MPHGYCTECDARVTAVDGECLLGHTVDPATISDSRGRRIAGTAASAIAVLERPLVRAKSPVRTSPRPEAPTRRPPAPSNHRQRPSVDPNLDLNPTGELVVKLWDETPAEPEIEDWQTGEPMSAMPERTTARLLSFLLLAAVVAAGVWALVLVFGDGVSKLDTLAASANELDEALATFDSSAAAPDFAAVDQTARQLLADAEALEVGDTSRALAIDAAGRVLDGERALSEAIAYQTGFVVFVGRPSLPVTATPDEISDVSEDFIGWITDFSGVLDDAPDHPTFVSHMGEVDGFLGEAEAIQANYLDALRAGDATKASAALAALDTRVAALQETMNGSLIASRESFDATAGDVTGMLGRIGIEE